MGGEVAPGQWLRESTVADSLGLSRTPVREALRMHAAEGVVEMVPNRGVLVISWTTADIDEVIVVYLASDESRYATGSIFRVDGGMTTL